MSRLRRWWLHRGLRKVLGAHLDALVAEQRSEPHRAVVQWGLSRAFLSNTDSLWTVRAAADLSIDPFASDSNLLQEQLRSGGFVLDSQARGLEWHRRGLTKSDAMAALHTLVYHYGGFPAEGHYSVALEPDRAPDNPKLRTAMKQLAKSRDDGSRKIVYQELLNSNLLLATEVPSPDGQPTIAEDTEQLQDRPVWLAFSGLETFKDNRVHSRFLTVSGIRLIQAALHHRIGALRLDHRSSVGGELYGNELESIARTLPVARPPGYNRGYFARVPMAKFRDAR